MLSQTQADEEAIGQAKQLEAQGNEYFKKALNGGASVALATTETDIQTPSNELLLQEQREDRFLYTSLYFKNCLKIFILIYSNKFMFKLN